MHFKAVNTVVSIEILISCNLHYLEYVSDKTIKSLLLNLLYNSIKRKVDGHADFVWHFDEFKYSFYNRKGVKRGLTKMNQFFLRSKIFYN